MSDQSKGLNYRASASAEAPYDHVRTLWGVADILGELSQARWQDNSPLYMGLETLAKTVRTAAHALDDYLEGMEQKGVISRAERMGTPADDEDQANT